MGRVLIRGAVIAIALASACSKPVGPGDIASDSLSPSSLASRVRDAYARAIEIEFAAHITHARQRIECSVICCRDGRHHLEVRNPGAGLVYILDQIPEDSERLRISERNLVTGKRDDCVITRQDLDQGDWDIKCGAGLGFDPCLFGGYLASWAGTDTHRSKFFCDVISAGEYRGLSRLAESPCYVIATNRPQRPGEEIWIDVRSGFVRRWRDPIRDRVYDYKSPNDSALPASKN